MRLCGQLERGVLLKDLPLELAQRGGRLDPELVGELAPEDLVAGERFGVPAGAVKGEHVLGAKALAQWVLAGQRFQFAHDGVVAAEREVSLEPRFERGNAELLKPRTLVLGERLGGELGQRGPAPERQRLAESVGRLLGAPCVQRRARLRHDALEPVEVEFVRLELRGSTRAGAYAACPAPASCAASRRRSAPSSARFRARSRPRGRR